MLKQIVVAISSICTITKAQIQNPGLTASIDRAVISQAKDVYFEQILNIIRDVKVPDIPFDQGYINGNTFVVTENSKNVNFTPNVSQNALIFSVTDLSGEFNCEHFKFKESVLVATGSVNVKMRNMSVVVGVKMDT